MQKSKKEARKVIKSLFLKIIDKSGMNFDKIISNVRTVGECEILELSYALENKALYWKPSITQMTYVKNNAAYNKGTGNIKDQKFEEI